MPLACVAYCRWPIELSHRRPGGRIERAETETGVHHTTLGTHSCANNEDGEEPSLSFFKILFVLPRVRLIELYTQESFREANPQSTCDPGGEVLVLGR